MREKSGLYAIQNLQTVPGQGLGGYGPTIILAEEFVKEVVENKTKRDEASPLYLMLMDNLKKSLGKDSENIVRLGFHDDTWLLTNMTLGLDCACFSIDGNARSKLNACDFEDIRYNPHNIDSAHVGAVIVSTWLLWFNHIITMTDFELPFAM